ncbi:MAG: beta-ketoacyl-[acyl-carrier-protein] synthase family protein [Marinifilaceae bacterium]|jgi:3-oxoacyl-[acyl-carrier-protein] synthase-1|nr:beta-ketoacyl-[acyl-carrier-protein] synthase family protein [Marinifilaceae bacterium]
MNQQVYITGMGIVSSIGFNKEETKASLLKEKTGIEKVAYLSTIDENLLVGEVKQSDEAIAKSLKINTESQLVDRTSLLGIKAVKEALDEANIRDEEDIVFVSGTTVGGMSTTEKNYSNYLSSDDLNKSIMTHTCGSSSEMIVDYFNSFSEIYTVSTACSSAANAIILGTRLIEQGKADIVVAGGCECLTKFHINGFKSLMIQSNELCRPFDKERKGLNLGEGAGYIVLESEKNLKSRKVKPLCRVSGWGNACDAYHQTAMSEDGNGPYAAMKEALDKAKLSEKDIDYINLHGTGTPNNDLSEGIAIKRLFSNSELLVSSTKSYTGHTTSASGGIESVISIMSLINGFLPANLGFNSVIEEHNIAPIKNSFKTVNLKHVMCNSFGFGGNDSSLIFSLI